MPMGRESGPGPTKTRQRRTLQSYPPSLVCVLGVLASIAVSLSSVPMASAVSGSSSARWSIPASPNVSSSFNELTAMSCVGPSFCVAVGNQTENGRSDPLSELWHGGSWSVVPSSEPSDQSAVYLAGVSCAAVSFCMAVGGGVNGAFLESWNGSAWAVVPSPAGQLSLSGVSCVSSTFCMAVGSTPLPDFAALAEEWDGSTWSIVPTPSSPAGVDQVSLNSVSCSSATLCASVGNEEVSEPVGFDALAVAQMWNGKAWSTGPASSPTTSTYLYGVSCPTATWCMAVGFSGASTLAERWNGTGWTVVPSENSGPSEQDNLLAVSCTGTSFCSAVGYQNSSRFKPSASPGTGSAG
jgi:hypothetical protein